MYYNPPIYRATYNLQHNNNDCFVFPVTGLEVDDSISIGGVTIYNYSTITEQIEQLKPFYAELIKFPYLKTIAHVNVKNVPKVWEEHCNNKLSIALMMLKQTIGFFYLTYYEYKGYADSKRIIISSNNIHESEEGMDLFFCPDGNTYFQNISEYLFLKIDKEYSKILYSRVELFLELYKMDTDLKVCILKQFEFLYDILNEIHSVERVYKMAAFLQVMFLKDSGQSFNYCAAKLKVFLLEMNQVKINTFGKHGKLNKTLCDLYEKIRNKYSHGCIDLYNEFNVINSSDYFVFYQVYMETLILLAYNVDFYKMDTNKDLLGYIESYRPDNL